MRIGVLSLYYENHNYGGLLQAFALVKFLEKRGFSAEQICHLRGGKSFFHRRFSRFWWSIKKFIRCSLHWRHLKYVRIEKFEQFEQNAISHTDIVYSNVSLRKAFEQYDTVIVGSDQVWNFDWTPDEYLLEHVPDRIKKISYAASIGRTELRSTEKDRFGKYLSRFDAISVREQDSVALLQPFAGKNKVEWVLDPTMLLTKEDWDDICPEQLVEGKYLFCYFLGPDKNMRNVAAAYAKKHGLKLVNLPHLTSKVLGDAGFGDEQLYSVSPADFISLVKYADFVFTDSFHGTIFSLLYHRQFCTFSRLNMPHMDNRVSSLLSMFDAGEYFLNTPERMTLSYVEQLQEFDYCKEFSKFEEMKKHSVEFLKTNLL